MKQNRQCPVCGVIAPLEEHHILPREYGGVNGPTINICGNCHSLFHKAATHTLKGGSMYEVLPQNIHNKAPKFVTAIVAAALASEGKRDLLDGRVILNLPNKMKQALHLLKQDKGYKNLEKFILDLLNQHLLNNGYNWKE